MCFHTEKHSKQLGFNTQKLVIVPITPSYSEDVEETPLKIGLINKCGEIVHVIGEVGFDTLVVTETWLTGGILHQKIVGDVLPAGYLFHHAAHTHRKGWGVEVSGAFAS